MLLEELCCYSLLGSHVLIHYGVKSFIKLCVRKHIPCVLLEQPVELGKVFTEDKVFIWNLYFFTNMLKYFKFKMGLNLSTLGGLGTAK